MARVGVDQMAFSDPRFEILASLMGQADPDFAIGKMARVWAMCTDRETYVLPRFLVDAIFKNPQGSEWLIQSDLAEEVKTNGGGLRIKGTKGRTDWLRKKRVTAIKNGKLGGRPKKPTLVSKEPTLVSEKTPLALASAITLAPALAEREEESAHSPKNDSDQISRFEAWSFGKQVPGFEEFMEAYPKKTRIERAREKWILRITGPELVPLVMQGLERWKASQDWADGKCLHTAATFLADRLFNEYPEPATNGQPKKKTKEETDTEVKRLAEQYRKEGEEMYRET